jgi:hypothetical protein
MLLSPQGQLVFNANTHLIIELRVLDNLELSCVNDAD